MKTKTAEILTKTPASSKYRQREWHIVAAKDNPNCFYLETAAGKVLCTLGVPEGGNTGFLNLIASAPELQDIAEMYYDAMLGKAEGTMVFEIVTEVLRRTQ